MNLELRIKNKAYTSTYFITKVEHKSVDKIKEELFRFLYIVKETGWLSNKRSMPPKIKEVEKIKSQYVCQK